LSRKNRPSHPVLKQLAQGEDILLCLLFTAMLCLACTQIFMRSVLSSGLPWADPLLRYLVLWCGLLGALKATGQGKHIALDFSNYLVPPSFQPWISLVTDLFCTITTAVLCIAAWIFIQNEIEFGTSSLLAIPLWGWSTIFPITFGLMSIRYGINLAYGIFDCLRSPPPGRAQNQ